jgi:hypothetical protein
VPAHDVAALIGETTLTVGGVADIGGDTQPRYGRLRGFAHQISICGASVESPRVGEG